MTTPTYQPSATIPNLVICWAVIEIDSVTPLVPVIVAGGAGLRIAGVDGDDEIDFTIDGDPDAVSIGSVVQVLAMNATPVATEATNCNFKCIVATPATTSFTVIKEGDFIAENKFFLQVAYQDLAAATA